MIDDKKLKTRYSTLVKSSVRYNVEPLKYEDLKQILIKSIDSGFKCVYCKKQLVQSSNDKYYRDVYSFDHITSFSNGGNNSTENINVCCHECNIIKGTLGKETFIKFFEALSVDERNRLFIEGFKGRLANKIERSVI